MPYPKTPEELAAQFKALNDPVAVRILGALLGADQNGQPQYHQGGVAFCKDKLGLESAETSYRLTNLCKAGLIIDKTPEKARFKEYAIDPNDNQLTPVLAQWASYVSSIAPPQAAAASGG